MTARHGAREVAGTPPEVRLGEAWADFARALSVYPETNVRVRATLDAFRKALEDAGRRHTDDAAGEDPGGVHICFREDTLLCCSGEHEFRDDSRLGWLKSRLDRSALAGVQFEPNAASEAIVAFTKHLLANFTRRRSNASFESLWPDTYEGVTLLDRRFEGSFGGGGRRAPWSPVSAPTVRSGTGKAPPSRQGDAFLDRVLDDPGIQRQLGRLAALGASDLLRPDGEQHSSREVLAHVVRGLPAEAFGSLEDVITATAGVLDAAAAAAVTEPPLPGGEAYDEASFAALMERVSRTHFLRASPGAERLPVARSDGTVLEFDEERARDALIADNMELLLEELEHLPERLSVDLRRGDGDSRAEQLAVLLHYVTRLERPEEVSALGPAIGRLLEEAEEPELTVLRSYLESGVTHDDGAWNPTVLRFLERTGNMRLLIACGVLTAERAVASFPAHFATYLQALDLKERDVRNELREVCRRIGDARLVTSAGDLVSAMRGIAPEQARAIAECADRNTLGLVRLLLPAHPMVTIPPAAQLLRALDLNEEEVAPLRHIDGTHNLTSAYLIALCEQHIGTGSAFYTRAAASHVLCRHIRGTRQPDPKTPTRLASIRALERFRSSEGDQLLRELAAGGWFGFDASEPRVVRRLAATILKEIKAG